MCAQFMAAPEQLRIGIKCSKCRTNRIFVSELLIHIDWCFVIRFLVESEYESRQMVWDL